MLYGKIQKFIKYVFYQNPRHVALTAAALFHIFNIAASGRRCRKKTICLFSSFFFPTTPRVARCVCVCAPRRTAGQVIGECLHREIVYFIWHLLYGHSGGRARDLWAGDISAQVPPSRIFIMLAGNSAVDLSHIPWSIVGWIRLLCITHVTAIIYRHFKYERTAPSL